jgi:hypothetical protein
MAGTGPRASIVLPKNIQFQIEGVGVKFSEDTTVECAASNLRALEDLVSKAGGTLANKAAAANATEAAIEVEGKLDQYQKATNQRIDSIGIVVQSQSDVLQQILARLPAAAPSPEAEKTDAKADKKKG